MAESYIALPPDSTGKRLRTRDRLIGANTVHEQAVFNPGQHTYYVMADAVAFAGGKSHIAIHNGSADKVIRLKKLFAINVQVTAVTGVAVRFDIKLLTALSAGTAITSQPCDSTNPPLDAGVLCRTGGTTTEGNILFPFVTNNDESGATNAFPTNVIQQFGNLIPEGLETQELVLRSAQGMTVRQITGTTVGSFAWLAVITQE